VNKQAFYQWRRTRACSAQPASLIMGILNVTPDSFSDGGNHIKLEQACDRAMAMIAQGADLIDIGGESTRPGADVISLDEELSRVIPVIERLAQMTDCCLSIDTYKPLVMEAAVNAGAHMINDTRALSEAKALTMAKHLAVPVCLMHMQGRPSSMQDAPYYERPVVDIINDFFLERIEACLHAGISREQLILDPGFGFGKMLEHNLQIMKEWSIFHEHKLPLLLGVSRKSTIGTILKKGVGERLIGGIALTVYAAMQGSMMFRTHDVMETRQALDMIEAIHRVE
jgi:dihydropteroate synthase